MERENGSQQAEPEEQWSEADTLATRMCTTGSRVGVADRGK